ncbi:MAG: agmatinase family protein [Gammaproteobacteria bacterium]|nr:agmatinase family protein [Gammaproteobacteria bacterium]
MSEFDPNAVASEDSGIFGLPYTEAESALVYVPVPWEVTTSYGGGTANGPSAILHASRQVDLFDLEIMRPYEAGLFMLPESAEVRAWNAEACAKLKNNRHAEKSIQYANAMGEKLNQYVFNETKRLLAQNKIPAIVGGDHSVPFGAFQAIAEKYPEYGVLHFDAHSDTREAFEGFTWSHASIMYNALQHIPEIKKLVQVGIRDFCEEEYDYTHQVQKDRVHVNFDLHLKHEKMHGKTWAALTEKMISPLPKHVWISFDIDGLDPSFCPNTGTPVPGGLTFDEANYLIAALVRSGRTIIGFDLNEVSPGIDQASEWDANVGARLLYKLTAWTLASQGICQQNRDG